MVLDDVGNLELLNEGGSFLGLRKLNEIQQEINLMKLKVQ